MITEDRYSFGDKIVAVRYMEGPGVQCRLGSSWVGIEEYISLQKMNVPVIEASLEEADDAEQDQQEGKSKKKKKKQKKAKKAKKPVVAPQEIELDFDLDTDDAALQTRFGSLPANSQSHASPE